jgi:hypothetical protein
VSRAGAGWPPWLLVTLLVLAVVLLIPLGWMACAMLFGGGMMGGMMDRTMGPGMMDGGMMGMHWAGLLGVVLLVVLLVALILLVLREISGRSTGKPERPETPEPPGGETGQGRKE